MMPSRELSGISDRRASDPRREAKIEAMAHAGRELAVQWAREPWSESWSRLVAEALLGAAERVDRVLAGAETER